MPRAQILAAETPESRIRRLASAKRSRDKRRVRNKKTERHTRMMDRFGISDAAPAGPAAGREGGRVLRALRAAVRNARRWSQS